MDGTEEAAVFAQFNGFLMSRLHPLSVPDAIQQLKSSIFGLLSRQTSRAFTPVMLLT